MKKIYVASSLNKIDTGFKSKLFKKLSEIANDVFFPDYIDLSAFSGDEMAYVDKICSREIRACDILIAIYPFGLSVATEIGRFLESHINHCNSETLLVILDTSEAHSFEFNKLRSEAMIMPHINCIVYSEEELLSLLGNLKA